MLYIYVYDVVARHVAAIGDYISCACEKNVARAHCMQYVSGVTLQDIQFKNIKGTTTTPVAVMLR